MSSHVVVFEVWLCVKNRLLHFVFIRAGNLPGIIVVFALPCGRFLNHLRRFLHFGQKEAKWRKNADRAQMYKGDRRARWTVVIGGRSDICSFLLCS